MNGILIGFGAVVVFIAGYLLGYVPGKRNYEEGEKMWKEGMSFLDEAEGALERAKKLVESADKNLNERKGEEKR